VRFAWKRPGSRKPWDIAIADHAVRGRFFHHRRFGRFAFFGGPFIYAGYYGGYYDGCWRRVWTPYGWQWADVCGYGYGNGYY
jgi:hypothetical protein